MESCNTVCGCMCGCDAGGAQVIEQTLVCTARVQLPPAVTKLVSVDSAVVEERSILDLRHGVLEVRTRNLTSPECVLSRHNETQ